MKKVIFGAGRKRFEKISKIHTLIFICRFYFLVFRAQSRLAGSQPKSAAGKRSLSDFSNADYLLRLSAARLALANIACTDYGNFSKGAFCDDDGRLRGGFSSRQNRRNRPPDVAADAR